MSFGLTQFRFGDDPEPHPTNGLLPWFTPSGMADRRSEASHIARMNQIRREAEQLVAGQAKHLMGELARQEAIGRAVSNAKYQLHRAHTESRLLAGEDPVLQAHFGILDDTMGASFRTGLVGWR